MPSQPSESPSIGNPRGSGFSRDAIAHAADRSSPVPIAHRGTLDLSLQLRHAGARRLRLRWEAVGAEDTPWVLVAGGISAGRHLAACPAFPEPGWWPAQAGPGRALDTTRCRLLAIDWLGADGSLDAPIDTADQADAIARLLAHLRIERLSAFVGCSYGAMVGLQFAARHPARVARLVAISGGDRAHPYASAWRGLQRRIARLGRDGGDSRDGLSLARQLAMLSYRTPEEFATRFASGLRLTEDPLHGHSARGDADDYLATCGERYVARTTTTAFLRLSESIDLHAVDPRQVQAPTTLVAVEQDQLVPVRDLVALAEALPALRRLKLLRSAFGHDAFLKEDAAIAVTLRDALRDALRGTSCEAPA
jgi:homoserine O-acetyltransferase